MGFSNYFFASTEIIGIISASISGCIIARKCKFDLFGIMLCAILSSLGGGIIRDILIGSLPPRSFYNYIYPLASVITSITVFAIFRILKSKIPLRQDLMRMLFLIFDAIGLASFSISGVQIGLESGYSNNGYLCIILGMTTAVGGGIIRDVITAHVPLVLREEIYATASILGSAIYYFAIKLGVNQALSLYVSMFLIILIRLLSIRYKWHLPKGDEE